MDESIHIHTAILSHNFIRIITARSLKFVHLNTPRVDINQHASTKSEIWAKTIYLEVNKFEY